MKYQKSMMKILEHVLEHRDKDEVIEQIIRATKSGRSSSFEAVRWLEQKGFVQVIQSGRQKIIKPVIDNYTLQYKYYIDALRFKTLNPFTKMVAMIFSIGMAKISGIKHAILFGSALSTSDFNDIDILISGKDIDTKALKILRDKIESVFSIIINLHYSDGEFEPLFKGIIIYQSSYLDLSSKLQTQYSEFLEWAYIAVKNNVSSDLHKEALEKSLINLSFCYMILTGREGLTKKEAEELFRKKYSVKILKDLLKIGVTIGEKIFR